jgi:hypothetical protein
MMSTFTFSFSTSELVTPAELAYLGECDVQHTYQVEAEMCFEDGIEDAYPHILTATCDTAIYYGEGQEVAKFAAVEIFQHTTGKYIWSELEAKAVDAYFVPTYEPHPAPPSPLTRPAASQPTIEKTAPLPMAAAA